VVVVKGVTLKFAPLVLLPIAEPPVATVYQSILLPTEVAFNKDEKPSQTSVGDAVTETGAAGNPTVTVTGVLEGEEHELLAVVAATCVKKVEAIFNAAALSIYNPLLPAYSK
jgi:hypothetical protein